MTGASDRAYARAALAGNPSDGYGGAVIAFTMNDYWAEVEVSPSSAPSVTPASALVAAAVRSFAREHAATSVAVRWSTNVPREIGLAGSSAIVTATVRALCALHGVALPPDRLAEFVLAVEVGELGIAAGLQDRVAQAYGGLIFMDFAASRYEQLDPALLPPLFLAHRADASGRSSRVHGDLKARFARGEPGVAAAMASLGELAREAREALLGGDRERLARCVDGSFELRRRIVELDPRHVAMIETARAAGASANYSGSGGAIVGTCRDEQHRQTVLEALRSAGCTAIAPQVGRSQIGHARAAIS
jgi:glucuronokinase